MTSEELIEVLGILKSFTSEGLAPYGALYLLYRFAFRPVIREVGSYLEARNSQASSFSELLSIMREIKEPLLKLLASLDDISGK